MYSMVDFYSEMRHIGQDSGPEEEPEIRRELDRVSKVIGLHPAYLAHYMNFRQFVIDDDGPLPHTYRHYLGIIAAARHQCTYLIDIHKKIFLEIGGDPNWLNGLNYIPKKLLDIYEINKILAHRPWMLNTSHIEHLTRGENNWSISELVHGIVLLSHFHSLSSFVFSCGLTQDLDSPSNIVIIDANEQVIDEETVAEEVTAGAVGNSGTSRVPPVRLNALMDRMRTLSESHRECSEFELNVRFQDVEVQVDANDLLVDEIAEAVDEVPQISQFIIDPNFTYQDFYQRGSANSSSTFRVQDYCWNDHGYSLVDRLYNDVGTYLDEKFRCAYNLTYFTMAGRKDVDTSKFRRAIWNYIQCIYGIRHDDYDYGEVNQLLEKPFKMFIKTACCFPERITKKDYDSVFSELKKSEKVHVNLMIMEARNQAELLYALREMMRYMT